MNAYEYRSKLDTATTARPVRMYVCIICTMYASCNSEHMCAKTSFDQHLTNVKTRLTNVKTRLTYV